MKKLIVSVCMVLVAALMLSASTLAWFSMNTHVTATGMKVKATSSQSLVIGTGTPVGTDISVVFDSGATTLAPATHSDTYDGAEGSANTTAGLKYLSSGSVNAATGIASSDAKYGDAVKGTHYAEYIVYIASSGQEMTDKQIVVTFNSVATIISEYTSKCSTVTATTVDFWAASGTTSATDTLAYKGKLCFADPDAELVVWNSTIPQNTSGFVKVVMRVYMDGELSCSYVKATGTYNEEATYYTCNATTGAFEVVAENSEAAFATYYVEAASGQKYVYTNSVDTSEVTFGVNFDAKDAPKA